MLKPGLVNHLQEPNMADRIKRLGDVHCHCYCAPRRLLHVESLGYPRDQRKKGGHTGVSRLKAVLGDSGVQSLREKREE
jgi:hypothetical protein